MAGVEINLHKGSVVRDSYVGVVGVGLHGHFRIADGPAGQAPDGGEAALDCFAPISREADGFHLIFLGRDCRLHSQHHLPGRVVNQLMHMRVTGAAQANAVFHAKARHLAADLAHSNLAADCIIRLQQIGIAVHHERALVNWLAVKCPRCHSLGSSS